MILLLKLSTYTLHLNATSRPQQFKTGVPQGGALSPTLFNIYTSDILKPHKNTTLTTYADDMNPAASHSKYLQAQETLQPYLEEICFVGIPEVISVISIILHTNFSH